MSQSKLISIGLPVFNGAKYIAQAIESVIRQNHGNFELVISDNASSDSTKSICLEYLNKDSRIRYQCNENTVEARLNFKRCVGLAKGDFFTWLAHDDYFTDADYLTKTVAELEAHDDVACGATAIRLVSEADEFIEQRNIVPCLPDGSANRKRMFNLKWSNHIYAIYGVFRRRVLAEMSFYEDRADKSFFLYLENLVLAQAALRGKIVGVDTVTRTVRYHEASGFSQALKTWDAENVDRYILGMHVRRELMRLAYTAPLGWREKLPLLCTAAGNFFISPWRLRVLLPTSIRQCARTFKRLIGMGRSATCLRHPK